MSYFVYSRSESVFLSAGHLTYAITVKLITR